MGVLHGFRERSDAMLCKRRDREETIIREARSNSSRIAVISSTGRDSRVIGMAVGRRRDGIHDICKMIRLDVSYPSCWSYVVFLFKLIKLPFLGFILVCKASDDLTNLKEKQSVYARYLISSM